jgi:ribosomal protein S18 acetylase RimI-like enzyme
MAIVTVTTTYLQMLDRAQARPAPMPPHAQVIEARVPLPDFYRFLYGAVGRDYSWTDRLSWSDERLRAHLSRPSLSLHVLYVDGTPAGYVELDRESHEPGTEVAYFGLSPAFHGRGLGKALLAYGVERAFDDAPERVWVHTCTLDGPYALANYQARGFVPYKTAEHEQELAS